MTGKLEEKLSYKFKDLDLLETALTHSSQSRKVRGYDKNNQRLEFLGDAFLENSVSTILFRRMEGKEEGTLTKVRASIVCEKSLVKVANDISLGRYMHMSPGEDKNGGRERNSNLADTMEALLGAIYLDAGFEEAFKICQRLFKSLIDDAIEGKLQKDFKTHLQEKIQGKISFMNIAFSEPISTNDIRYEKHKEEGPDHDKIFYIDLFIKDNLIGRGVGRNKKEAEQEAAENALRAIERK